MPGAQNPTIAQSVQSNHVSFAPQPIQQIHQAYQPQLPTDQMMMGNFSAYQYPGADAFDLFDVNDTFLENVDLSSFFLNPDFSFDQNQFNQWHGNYNNETAAPTPQQPKALRPNDQQAEQSSISRFGSPLPSVRPDGIVAGKHYRDVSEHAKTNPCWKLSASQYETIRENLAGLSEALPPDFVLPSRLSVSRYIEGCMKGVLEHIPMVHIPTWSATSCAPDLLLAILAIGAQYRFEDRFAFPLFYAAKAAVGYQVRLMKKEKPHDDRSRAPSLRRESSTTSPASTREQFLSPGNPSGSPSSHDVQSLRPQTIAAVIILMVQGSWGPAGQMLSDALSFQSLLSELIRDEGVGAEDDDEIDTSDTKNLEQTWHRYICVETRRRSMITGYNFINLQSMAYNFPPTMLTSEIKLYMPVSQSEWLAKTAEDWVQARKSSTIRPLSFANAVRSLFQSGESGTNTPSGPYSAVGNYSLMFAILQSIFFLRESSKAMPVRSESCKLREDDIESLSRALQNWQTLWENSPESSVDPHSANGPVAFNSTALLRLAWIRIHSDLGPCRNLASRNPVLIVEAFKSCPPLHRSPGLTPALLHAAHALSVPVRLGIPFVAKTQTLGWSIQHALCNLECAVFLSKWFEDMESTTTQTPITSQEKGLISLIRSIVEEAGFFKADAFEPAVDDDGWQRLIQHLGTAIAALWAEIFSGTHVFELVGTIGTSLDIYAKLLENAHTPIWPMR